MPLGSAVLTSAGRFPYRGIIHVAGINMLWRASERSIRDSTVSAVRLAEQHNFHSLAFPLIGAGSGGFNQEKAKAILLSELESLGSPMQVTLTIFKRLTQATAHGVANRPLQRPDVL
jgi:O-acetyl-ADP-ribose deacetylase (regulator of RNase III)